VDLGLDLNQDDTMEIFRDLGGLGTPSMEPTTTLTVLPLYGASLDLGQDTDPNQCDNMESFGDLEVLGKPSCTSSSSCDDVFSSSLMELTTTLTVLPLYGADLDLGQDTDLNECDNMEIFRDLGEQGKPSSSSDVLSSMEPTTTLTALPLYGAYPDLGQDTVLNQYDNMESFGDVGVLGKPSSASSSSCDDVFSSSSMKPTTSLTSLPLYGANPDPDPDLDLDQVMDPDLDDSMESFEDMGELGELAKPSSSSNSSDSHRPRSVTEQIALLAYKLGIELSPEPKHPSEMTKQELAAWRCRMSRLKKRLKFQWMERRLDELERENQQLKRKLSSLSSRSTTTPRSCTNRRSSCLQR